jgi:uncharacterized protein YuzE
VIKLSYDTEADALALQLRQGGRSARMVRASDTVNVDFDDKGRLLTVEVLLASLHVSRAALEALPPTTDWLTLPQAERESGLRRSTLRVLLNRGRLEGERRGRDWFVSGSALSNYLESREARGRRPSNAKARRRTSA